MNEAKAKARPATRLLLWLAVVPVLALLYFIAPDGNAFYPHCIFHSLTGLNCPFCGGTRAAHQLLHGNFAAAFALNPLLVVGVPLIAICALVHRMVYGATGGRTPGFVWSPLSSRLIVAVIVIFGVLRNLPAFSWMSP